MGPHKLLAKIYVQHFMNKLLNVIGVHQKNPLKYYWVYLIIIHVCHGVGVLGNSASLCSCSRIVFTFACSHFFSILLNAYVIYFGCL